MKYLINTLAVLSVFLIGKDVLADDGRLFILQPISVDKNTYVVSKQIDAMKMGFELGINAFKAKFPNSKCEPDISANFDIHTDANLYEEIRRISTLQGKKVVVGLTRTNLARLAAHSAAGTDIIGVSSGSTSDELRDINKNFISVGTATQQHWKAGAIGMKGLNCTPDNTLGIFAFKDVWSGYYMKSFLADGYKLTADINEFLSAPDIQSNVKCIFFGVTAPASVKPLSKLLAMEWPGVIIGNLDWTFFSAEIRTVLADYKKRASQIYATVNWRRDETEESQNWANKHFGNTTLIEPIHFGTYESTIIALNYLCRGQDVLKFDRNRWKHFGMLRTYGGMSESGNLETSIQLVKLPLAEWN
jgi:hypothetical protein